VAVMSVSTTFGRFVVEQRVGAGGMGVVYRAHERNSGTPVAVKLLLHADAHANAHAASRFEREAGVLAELQHPAIVAYVAHGVSAEGQPFLAMEWLEGIDLRARLALGVLDLSEALMLGARMAGALAFAHARGILHRDFKPSNVFLPGGRIADAKLIDFGVARILGDDVRLTGYGTPIGIPAYMAPEQVRGDRHVDARADLFALGAVLFECLAGRPPHQGASSMAIMTKRLLEEAPRLASLRPDVPSALNDLIAQLLALDAAHRPAETPYVAEALAALASGQEPPGAPVRAAAHAAALGAEEGTLVCVVLSVAEAASFSSLSLMGGDQTETVESQQPLSGRTSLPGPVAALAERHGARIEPLRDGSFAAVLSASAGAAATDLGLRGARLALGLRELGERSHLAMAVGTAVLSRPLALDAIIETVAQLAAKPPRPGSSAGVRIDATSAGLLIGRFQLLRDGHDVVLVGECARPDDDDARRLLGTRTRFVGRARELRALRSGVEAALAGRGPRALVVAGAAGIGKSRLVAELLRTLAGQAVTIWSGGGDPVRQATPFGLLASMVRSAAEIEEGVPAELARARLGHLADGLRAHARARVIEFLAELCGMPGPEEPGEQLRAARESPLLLADQLQRAWEDLVLEVTRTRPLLLVLEDLHWADAASLKLAEAALRVGRSQRLAILATTRAEGARVAFAGHEVSRIPLGEMTPRASARLVASLLGDRVDRVDPTLAQRLAKRGAGNALYLEELVRAVAAGDEAASRLPGTVKAMVMARLAALDAGPRRVLRAGSVFGECFSSRGVAALLGDPTDGLETRLVRVLERLRERE